MTSHRSSPRPHLPHLAWIVSALLLLSLLGWSGVPATSAPSAPALTLYSPAPGALHLTWPATTPAPPAYHVQYAPADTPTLIEQATSPTPSLTLYELEPGVLYTVQVRAGTGPWSVPGLQRIDDYRADPDGRDHRRGGGGDRLHRKRRGHGLVFRGPGRRGGLSH